MYGFIIKKKWWNAMKHHSDVVIGAVVRALAARAFNEKMPIMGNCSEDVFKFIDEDLKEDEEAAAKLGDE